MNLLSKERFVLRDFIKYTLKQGSEIHMQKYNHTVLLLV